MSAGAVLWPNSTAPIPDRRHDCFGPYSNGTSQRACWQLSAVGCASRSAEGRRWIKTSLGWYVVRVQKVTPEKQPNFKELEPQLKQALQQENQQKAIDDFKNLFYARWGARTTCASGYDDLVACGGQDTTATTPAKLHAPPGAGIPQFPKPKVDPNTQLQQLQQGAQQGATGAATTAGG